MAEPRLPTSTCFVCGGEFVCGGGQWEIDYIRSLEVSVCRGCKSANWDGLAPNYETKLLAHLTEKGLPVPARNSKGLIPLG